MQLYSLPISEQDTVIQFSRDKDEAIVDTTDRTTITKLDKLVNSSDCYTLDSIHTVEGKECGRRYKINKKSLISFRREKTKKNLSEEQRKALADRLRGSRQNKK